MKLKEAAKKIEDGIEEDKRCIKRTAAPLNLPQTNYPNADPISTHRIGVLTFLHPAYMDKGTGHDEAITRPQWANGGCLPGPVPLPAVSS